MVDNTNGTEAAVATERGSFKAWIDNHPEEEMRLHKTTMIPFALIVLLAIIFGSRHQYTGMPTFIFGSSVVSGLSIMEATAIMVTLVLSIAYTLEVFREAKADGALGGSRNGRTLLVIGGGSVLNCFVIIYAGWYLRSYTASAETDFSYYIGYVVFTFFAFLIFTILDFLAMYKSCGWKLARSYWGLTLFCDGPAAVAFLLVLAYISIYSWQSGSYPRVETIGGAVAMQLMIANTIYLIIATNLFFLLYKKYACAGVERP